MVDRGFNMGNNKKKNKEAGKKMPIYTYAYHSSTSDIRTKQPLHIVVHHYLRKREDEQKERAGGYWRDCESPGYGSLMESECGLSGMLLKTDGDVIRDEDYDYSMGLRKFHEIYGGGINNKVHFFMPPLLRNSMDISIAEGAIPKDRICDKCKEVLEARITKLRSEGHKI